MNYSKEDLAKYRFNRARESLVDADYRDYRDVSESEIQPLIEVAEQMIFLIEKKIF